MLGVDSNLPTSNRQDFQRIETTQRITKIHVVELFLSALFHFGVILFHASFVLIDTIPGKGGKQ